MAETHLQSAHGLDEGDAARLASAFSNMGISDAGSIDKHLATCAALKTPLSSHDWCSCFSRCPEVLGVAPAVLQERVNRLQQLMRVSDEQAAATITKAPSLLQHEPQDVAEKVQALQAVMALPAEAASPQLIIERFSRYPAILARSVEALEAQLSGLAGLLGCDLQLAARLAFKVPALAASANDELQAHIDLLVQLLRLDLGAVRGLVLRQPSLLARGSEGLQAKVEAYDQLFEPDTGLALAAAPQLLTMKADAVKSRFELLSQLAELQPAWSTQLEEATVETLAVWLCSSEKKLRRLEVAARSPKLSRLQLYRLLSHSEGRWASELASAGLTPEGQELPGGPVPASVGGGGGGGGSAGAGPGSSGKPKRPRGGRRERERKKHIAARQAAEGSGGDGSGGGAAQGSQQPGGGGGGGSAAVGAAGSSDKPKRPRGGRRERERKERIAARQAAAEAGGGADEFGAHFERRAGEGGGVGGAPGANGECGSHSGGEGGEGADAARSKRATRGGRREREKRERLAAKLAGQTATGVASGVLGDV